MGQVWVKLLVKCWRRQGQALIPGALPWHAGSDQAALIRGRCGVQCGNFKVAGRQGLPALAGLLFAGIGNLGHRSCGGAHLGFFQHCHYRVTGARTFVSNTARN